MSMTKRDVIRCVLDGEKPPYVPWSFKFTKEPREILQAHYGVEDLDPVLYRYLQLSLFWNGLANCLTSMCMSQAH